MPQSEASTSDLVVLAASQTVTTGTAVALPQVNVPEIRNGVQFVLDVSAAAAAAGDTFDVTVQALIAPGIWADVIHFTQVLGNGGTKRFIAKILGPTVVALYAYAALTAGNQKDTLGDYWRVVYSVVDGGAHGQSFTFSVTALPF
jgi:hypothetical protein